MGAFDTHESKVSVCSKAMALLTLTAEQPSPVEWSTQCTVDLIQLFRQHLIHIAVKMTEVGDGSVGTLRYHYTSVGHCHTKSHLQFSRVPILTNYLWQLMYERTLT